MTAQLKASLLLELKGQLAAGLDGLLKQMEKLRDMGRSLGFGGLEEGLDELRGGLGAIDKMTNSLKGAERQADRTGAAIGRMARDANSSIIRVNSQGVAQLQSSLGALAVLGAAVAGGGGRGGGGRGGGGFPLLGGPGGGGSGIPLNLRAGGGWGGVLPAGRGVLSATKGFTGAVGAGITGAMGAFVEGAAVYEPIKMYAEYEQKLRQIGITKGLSGPALDAEIKRLDSMFSRDAMSTAQTPDSIAEAYADLIGTGFSGTLIDKVIGTHSQAATAYGITPEAMGHAVGALLGNLKISDKDLGGSLAAMAKASQSGLYKITDFSRGLPEITGNMASLGMTGRGSADQAFAAMEVVMKAAGDPGTGAANFHDLLAYLTSNRENNMFGKKQHINLAGYLKAAEKKGIDPLDAFLKLIGKMVKGKSPVAQSEIVSSIVTNQQARNALLALLQHKDEFDALRKTLDAINQSKLDQDFLSALADPNKQLEATGIALTLIAHVLGESFAPVLHVVNVGLQGVLFSLRWMNENMPGTTHVVLGVVGSLLAFGAALGVIGVVWPVIAAGWGVVTAVFGFLVTVMAALVSPLGVFLTLATAVAFAAYDIYANWDRFGAFFQEMWAGVRLTFQGFYDFLAGAFTLDFGRAMAGLGNIGNGLSQSFKGDLDICKNVFVDFEKWVDDWSGGLMSRVMTHMRDGAMGWMAKIIDQVQTAGATHADGTGAPGGAGDRLHITVEAAPGSAVTSATSSNPRHTVTVQNPGRVMLRP